MASGRALNSTDESGYSIGPETRQAAIIAQQFIDSHELEFLSPEVILGRSLSVKSVISTPSSFARRLQQARNRPDLQHFLDIGKGLQGTIFEKAGMSHVLKKETPSSNTGRSLEEEFRLHGLVYDAFAKYGPTLNASVKVPRPYGLIRKSDDEFWTENASKFPAGHQTPTTTVQMERILPLPKVVRKALIQRFHPTPDPETVARILGRDMDKHCLVRTYLGRKNRPREITDEEFSLRNFQLFLDPMRHMSLDVMSLATLTGQAFAIMHWGAGVDGDDVEFVLGTSATTQTADQMGQLDLQHRAVGLYLLDFGQCRAVDLLNADEEEVYQQFRAAMIMGDNQLFIPHYKETGLFGAFSHAYKSAAGFILEERGLDKKFNVEDFFEMYVEYTEDFLPGNY